MTLYYLSYIYLRFLTAINKCNSFIKIFYRNKKIIFGNNLRNNRIAHYDRSVICCCDASMRLKLKGLLLFVYQKMIKTNLEHG